MKTIFQKKLATKAIGLLGVLFIFANATPVAIAQTDTEFWFVIPEVTINHQMPGGVPASFRFSSGSLPASITISMPANSAVFPDITFDMNAYEFRIIDLSCWIVSPCNPPFSPATGYSDLNLIENKPYTASGINNVGIRITSTTPITVYYEVSRTNNKDIWTLKGRNGLGTEFFTPFQTNRDNQSITPTQPYSAIDVVATADNTVVTFSLPPGLNASYGSTPTSIGVGGTLTRTLNRGQTFSLFPLNYSRTAANRLRGVRITSTKNIAVSIKDDSFFHTRGTCYDLAGDQLVPTSIIGKEYIVIRTDLFKPLNNDPNPSPISNEHDHIYILATQDNTTITIYNPDGSIPATTTPGIPYTNVDKPNPYTLNARQQLYVRLPAPNEFYRVVADKPVYVWHVGGFGCEQGGAILPPIDKCTGVPRVSFARTSSETFYMIMMVRKGAEPNFRFMVQQPANSGTFVDKTFLLYPPTSLPFIEVDGSEWSVRRFGPFTTAQIPVTSHYMENSEDIFHLGIVNGERTSGCFYGYFSDYNEFNPGSFVVETGTSAAKICYGGNCQLYASGGTSYMWVPSDFLDNDESPTPLASNMTYSVLYEVTVSGACDQQVTLPVNVQVSDYIEAVFSADIIEGNAPLDVLFTDSSIGATNWHYDFGDGDELTTSSHPTDFSHTFYNPTDNPIDYTVNLTVTNDGCSAIKSLTITVYPDPNLEKFDLNLSANPDNSGTVTGQGKYAEGAIINLTATPNPGYEFVSWTIDGTVISNDDSFTFTMPPHDVTIIANFIVITYTVLFDIKDPFSNSLTDAIVTFNGIQNAPGQYLFSDIEPGTYSYSVSHGCSQIFNGQITVTNSDVTEQVIMQTFPGDANGDKSVNVIDIAIMVGHILDTYSGYFCFHNADVITNDIINIQDIVATANIILGEKPQAFPSTKSNAVDIYLCKNGITIRSDGTITGLQFELESLQLALQLKLLSPTHQLSFRQQDNRIIALVYNLSNTPFPAGEFKIVDFENCNALPEWGNIIAVNTDAEVVAVQKHVAETTGVQAIADKINLIIYPNPARDRLNISFTNLSVKVVKLKITSLHGQKVKEAETSKQGNTEISLDISNIPAGVYLISMEYDGEIINRMIVIQ